MNEQFILNIMEKFDSSDITSLKLKIGDANLVLGKGSDNVQVVAPVATPMAMPASVAVPVQSSQPAVVTEAASAVEETVIKSPIVGTFYRSPSPDAPSYVEVGKSVKKGEPLCILEAMKMMNSLEAEFDCVIEKILVSNGDLVEFDQPIFQVKKYD